MDSKTINQNGRLVELDVLKAIALFAVILYHTGVQPYGYLGVDIFLVINGYVVIRSLLGRLERCEKVSYFGFICQKVAAFWPLILLAGIVCLVLGWFTMLPDDYENAAESVVAANLFANNILMAITTKDYWAVVNDYKPLMHTWYISLLVQSYLLLPIIPLAAARCRNGKHICGGIYAILTIASFAVFAGSLMPGPQTFYYLPCRFFEITLGAVIAGYEDEIRKALNHCGTLGTTALALLALIGLLLLLLIPGLPFSSNARLTAICLLTAIFIAAIVARDSAELPAKAILMPIASLGQATFSFYVWHQVILAFVRYTLKSDFTVTDILLYLVCVILLGLLSNRLIEKPLAAFSKRHLFRLLLGCGCVCVLSCAASLLIYVNAGVIRDVPELDIDRHNAQRSMHAVYNERAAAYDRDFDAAGDQPRILVIGDSFGRDFINILLESGIDQTARISYIDLDYPEAELRHPGRIEQADRIFITFAEKYFTSLPDALREAYAEGKVYVVGNKAYGDCMGVAYNRRHRADYFDTSMEINEELLLQNDILRDSFGDHFIDMITPVQKPDGTVKSFTDENKFISQDGKHLTQSGARYYARLLDLSGIC